MCFLPLIEQDFHNDYTGDNDINGHNDISTVGNDGDNDIVSMEVASDLAAVFIQPLTWAVISSTL